MKKGRFLAALSAVAMLLLGVTACGEDSNGVSTVYTDKAYGFQTEQPSAGDTVAIMHTSMGDISIRLFPEAAPKAVENFTTHAKNGYYNGLTFHRVMNDFMIQGGDPDGDGTGGDSIWGTDFADEFDEKLLNIRGALSMANAGVNTNGSQFFINQAKATGETAEKLKASAESQLAQVLEQAESTYDSYEQYYGAQFTEMYPTVDDFIAANLLPDSRLVPDEVWELYAKHGGNISLDGAWRASGGHTVFGHVYEGMDIVDKIAAVDTDEDDKPTTAVTITSIEIKTY